MQTIQRVNDPTLDRRPDGRVCVRFKLNREPDLAWVDAFRVHAASSALGGASAICNGVDVAIEIAKGGTVPELATALDCFIECANLRLRAIPSQIPQRREPGIPPIRVPQARHGIERIPQAIFSSGPMRRVAGRGPNGTRMSSA